MVASGDDSEDSELFAVSKGDTGILDGCEDISDLEIAPRDLLDRCNAPGVNRTDFAKEGTLTLSDSGDE